MFGPNIVTSGLSFGKIIGGISKTLGIANQIIPLYKEIKPVIGNAKSLLSIVKEFGNSKNNIINDNVKNNTTKKVYIKDAPSNSNPVFFQ